MRFITYEINGVVMIHHRTINGSDIYEAGIIDPAHAPGCNRTASDDTPPLGPDFGRGSICPVSGVGCPRAAPDPDPNFGILTGDRRQARDR